MSFVVLEDTLSDLMSREWDCRAIGGTFYGHGQHAQADSKFYNSDEEDVRVLVDRFLAAQRLDARKMSTLEIGCGVGRMTGAFARRFSHVKAVDVSQEMINKAKKMVTESNIIFAKTNGIDLSGIQSASVDFIFSYKVFQHLPNAALMDGYMQEMKRVMKIGGYAMFQMRSHRRYHLPKFFSKLIFRIIGNKHKASDSFLGITITRPVMKELLKRNNMKVTEIISDTVGERSIDYIVVAQKQSL